jgi:MFS superfamily sulfate permease-like transporter
MNDYPRAANSLRYDIPAGLVVALVALPLCLGIALASGAPLASGLISGIVGGIVVGLLSGSPLSVTGPAAGLTAVVVMSITQLGTFEAFLLSVFLSGLIQIVLGLANMGGIVNYFPSTVIKGMLAGIGVIIILKQIPYAVGYDKLPKGEIRLEPTEAQNSFSELSNVLNHVSPGAIIITLVSMAFMLLWDKPWAKRFQLLPGALVAVLLGVGLNSFFKYVIPSLALDPEHLVHVPVKESLSALIGDLSHPNWTLFTNTQVWTVAFTIAIVASIETLLCIEAVDKLDPFKRHSPANRELFAQGAGNMVCGLVGGLPVTSVIVRSSANLNAGGRTKVSAIFHGLLLLLCVWLIPQLLNLIPLASLAAILLLTGWKLTKPSTFGEMYQQGWLQFLPFISTIIAMVLTDLLKGVCLGLLVSVFFILRENMKNSLVKHSDQGGQKYLELGPHITFLHKAQLMKIMNQLPDHSSVILDASKSYYVDPDIIAGLKEFKLSKAISKGLNIEFIGDAFHQQTLISNH